MLSKETLSVFLFGVLTKNEDHSRFAETKKKYETRTFLIQTLFVIISSEHDTGGEEVSIKA